jgi:hypothetical protein
MYSEHRAHATSRIGAVASAGPGPSTSDHDLCAAMCNKSPCPGSLCLAALYKKKKKKEEEEEEKASFAS